ncbi:protein IQ-DOMAIN 10 isoform X2 [Malania oleifera]|uniref:protein IQ-DOMAIN 10 isoform X2 n=1 Tax=Malania oleifera TaxID=397392 RepID=UPI0025AE82A8|nr:protein IQ-DOMAIN 10 isoform X2 [Malania oleifera]XP_057963567.1 protein IQ-DOMAIN 10 isoform X2 [Malania oleifera]
MGLSWFKAIISLKKVKEDRSKKAKVHSANEKSAGSKWRHRNGKYSSRDANGTSSQTPSSLGVPVKVIAAIRIQTAFRAFMARKTLRRLKGTVKFQVLIEDHTAKNQALNTLSHIHSWSRIQAQIHARRLCMVTEGRLKQKKLENQQKLEAKLHELEVEWCSGSETMEEILSRIQHREEAAVKRERAMAYAFSHQWRANSSQYLGQAYYDLGKDNWGWSWKERWVAARPWEIRVHCSPINPKKVQAKQATKGGKITDQPSTKITVPALPASSNGKGTMKGKTLPYPNAGKDGDGNAEQEQVTA